MQKIKHCYEKKWKEKEATRMRVFYNWQFSHLIHPFITSFVKNSKVYIHKKVKLSDIRGIGNYSFEIFFSIFLFHVSFCTKLIKYVRV